MVERLGLGVVKAVSPLPGEDLRLAVVQVLVGGAGAQHRLSPRRVWDRGGGDASARSDGRERREPVPRSGGSNGEQLRLRRPGGQQPCSLGGVRRPARAVAQVGVRGVVRSWRMDLSVEGHFAFFAHPEPVSLRALESVGELEAVHLQHVEEGVAHRVGDAVLGLHQTAVELVVAVAVGHGEDVAVEDAKLDVKGRDGVLALVVLPAAFVRL